MHLIRIFAVLFASMLLTATARSQDVGYTQADAEILQQCIEAVRDVNADPDASEEARYKDCIGKASEACQEEGQQSMTTMGMVACAAREAAWWDEQLNTSYAQLRDSLDAGEFDRLRDAQRAWITYKDARCDFEYFYWREGTIRSLFGSSCILQETAERSIDLMNVLDWMNY